MLRAACASRLKHLASARAPSGSRPPKPSGSRCRPFLPAEKSRSLCSPCPAAMDGLLAATYLFPGLIVFNFVLSALNFTFSIVVAFGPDLQNIVLSYLGRDEGVLPIQQLAGVGRQEKLLYPFLVSFVSIWTVFTTYGFGGAMRHQQSGWRFVQPCRGGMRFVFLQILTWTTFTLAVVLPWTTVKGVGWLLLSGMVEDPTWAEQSGLLVAGAALGMLSNTFCVLALMSFDRRGDASFTERWNFGVFGDAPWYWLLFLALNGALVVYSVQISIMLDTLDTVKHSLIEAVLLMVVTLLLAVPVALTSTVGGKWRHGEKKFKLIQPFKGGNFFIRLQGLGWALYALATSFTLYRLFTVLSGQKNTIPVTVGSLLGLFSYGAIFASLFYFEPDADAQDSEPGDDDDAGDYTIASVTGKRSSPSVQGAVEYLVHWKRNGHVVIKEWVLDEDLKRVDENALRGFEATFGAKLPGGNSGSTNKAKKKRRQPQARSSSPPVRDAWDELEDEHGNVFFRNVTTGRTVTRLPG